MNSLNNKKTFIKPLTNNFAVDGDLITDFLDNFSSKKYSNNPHLKNWSALEESLINGSGNLFNTEKLMEYHTQWREGVSIEVPVIQDLTGKFMQALDQSDNDYKKIPMDELFSKNNSTKPILCNEIPKNVERSDKYIISRKDILNKDGGYHKISSKIKTYDLPKLNIDPASFFAHHACFNTNNFFIYDPYLYEQGLSNDGKKKMILGFDNKLKPVNDGEYIKKMAEHLLFYISWIDKSLKGSNIKPKIYFAGRLNKPDYNRQKNWFYLARKLFLEYISKDFTSTPPEADKDKIRNIFHSKPTYSLLKKYFNSINLIAFPKDDEEYKLKILKKYGKDNDHRNIILTDYMNLYWDLRGDYINSPKQKNEITFNLGKKEESQSIVIHSIFNDDFHKFPNKWNKIFNCAQYIIDITRESEIRFNVTFKEKIVEYLKCKKNRKIKIDKGSERFFNCIDLLKGSNSEFKIEYDLIKKELLKEKTNDIELKENVQVKVLGSNRRYAGFHGIIRSIDHKKSYAKVELYFKNARGNYTKNTIMAPIDLRDLDGISEKNIEEIK